MENAGRPVWVRRGVTSYSCPKSKISSDSLYFLEQFHLWKRFGSVDPLGMNARTAEAISVLEDAWQEEQQVQMRAEGNR